MVSKKTIYGLDFKNIYQYYEYIIDSKVNGNYKQVENLVKDLSKPQKIEFLNFLSEYGQNENIIYLNNLTINNL